MLAADLQSNWTYGFIQRDSDHVLLMREQPDPIESALHRQMLDRLDLWEQVRDGFPALSNAPFAAATIREWNRAIAARADHEKRQAIAVAEARDKLKSAFKVLVMPAQDDVQEVSDGVVVIPGDYELTMPYKALVGCQTALRPTPAIFPIRNALQGSRS